MDFSQINLLSENDLFSITGKINLRFPYPSCQYKCVPVNVCNVHIPFFIIETQSPFKEISYDKVQSSISLNFVIIASTM